MNDADRQIPQIATNKRPCIRGLVYYALSIISLYSVNVRPMRSPIYWQDFESESDSAPLFKTLFLVRPNGISIGSAVLSELTIVTNRQTHVTDRQTTLLCGNSPRLTF